MGRHDHRRVDLRHFSDAELGFDIPPRRSGGEAVAARAVASTCSGPESVVQDGSILAGVDAAAGIAADLGEAADAGFPLLPGRGSGRDPP